MSVFSKSSWIWHHAEDSLDEYADFFDSFTYSGGKAILNISCDSDYTLYVNGNYAASGQYADFIHYKIYDTLDITNFLREGENELYFLVHYFGRNSSRYRKEKAGLIYEVLCDGKLAAVSSTKTRTRQNPSYACGRAKIVTIQLGFSFLYDSTKPTDTPTADAKIIEKEAIFFPRPIKKHRVLPRVEMKSVTYLNAEKTRVLVDLGAEYVGLPTLEISSPRPQTVTVAFGEHIADGNVRRKNDVRDFSFEYVASAGENSFTNYMLRLGARYLELSSPYPVDLKYLGVLPQVYELKERAVAPMSYPEGEIYKICINTLRLCMMEHYVDCPWREQALYAFDSRNQMLTGYYAFEGGNYDYAKANLTLMNMDRRANALLSICAPSGGGLTIPSFSLYYIVELEEYFRHTGDVEFIREVLPRVKALIDHFLENQENGLICKFAGEDNWNFYDWVPGLEGTLHKPEEPTPDGTVNFLMLLTLSRAERLYLGTGLPFPYENEAAALAEAARKAFITDEGVVSHTVGGECCYALDNALAILSGALDDEQMAQIAEKIASGALLSSTLSMNIFIYEALMLVSAEKYRDYILADIRKNYEPMIETGTVWETAEGEAAFGKAGSLCHGWSAVPVYIYHRLGIAKYSN